MKKADILRVWRRVFQGYTPFLSIEITKECPHHCPGCYAYSPEHLGPVTTLRELSDYRGQDLVKATLAVVRRVRPVHLSIVGGEPLIRYRELCELLPLLNRMGVEVQLVSPPEPHSPSSRIAPASPRGCRSPDWGRPPSRRYRPAYLRASSAA